MSLATAPSSLTLALAEVKAGVPTLEALAHDFNTPLHHASVKGVLSLRKLSTKLKALMEIKDVSGLKAKLGRIQEELKKDLSIINNARAELAAFEANGRLALLRTKIAGSDGLIADSVNRFSDTQLAIKQNTEHLQKTAEDLQALILLEDGTAIKQKIAIMLGGLPILPESGELSIETEAEDKSPRPPVLTVLIVDDNKVNQRLLVRALTTADKKDQKRFDIITADNGLEAVTKCNELKGKSNGQFDFILMDLSMPVMDGFEATRQIRKLGIATPIVALTASPTFENKAAAEEAGMDGFLPKPFELPKILDLMQKLMVGKEVPSPGSLATSPPKAPSPLSASVPAFSADSGRRPGTPPSQPLATAFAGMSLAALVAASSPVLSSTASPAYSADFSSTPLGLMLSPSTQSVLQL